MTREWGQGNEAEKSLGRVETQSENFLVSTLMPSFGSFRHSLVPIPLSGSSFSYHLVPNHFADGLLFERASAQTTDSVMMLQSRSKSDFSRKKLA